MVKMLIAGEQTDATATDELEVVDPATEDVYDTVPAGDASASVRPGPLTMSPSDRSAISIRARCGASALLASARPRSSSRASARRPFRGPERTSAGLAPRNAGVRAMGLPHIPRAKENCGSTPFIDQQPHIRAISHPL